MSNVGRPRTELKGCPFDGATTRDSNGQCHCRNVLYRERRKAPQQEKKIEKTFNQALKAGKTPEEALVILRDAVPALKPTRKPRAEKAAPAKKAAKPEPKPEPEPEAKPRYVLTVDGFEETPYARKDAAIKNGVRSGEPFTVTYKGKIVHTSDA
jgi:cell division septation protein DedD